MDSTFLIENAVDPVRIFEKILACLVMMNGQESELWSKDQESYLACLSFEESDEIPKFYDFEMEPIYQLLLLKKECRSFCRKLLHIFRRILLPKITSQLSLISPDASFQGLLVATEILLVTPHSFLETFKITDFINETIFPFVSISSSFTVLPASQQNFLHSVILLLLEDWCVEMNDAAILQNVLTYLPGFLTNGTSSSDLVLLVAANRVLSLYVETHKMHLTSELLARYSESLLLLLDAVHDFELGSETLCTIELVLRNSDPVIAQTIVKDISSKILRMWNDASSSQLLQCRLLSLFSSFIPVLFLGPSVFNIINSYFGIFRVWGLRFQKIASFLRQYYTAY